MRRAVVFDLDGVLVDSEPVWERVRRAFVAEHGGTWRHDTQRRLMGMSTGEWAAHLHDLGVSLPPAEIARGVVDRMAAEYVTHLPLLPGADAAVRRVSADRVVGLASSSPRRLIDAVLAATGWRFATTRSTEQEARGKPAPDVYATVTAALGVAPDAATAVEDSSNGLRSASAAGLRVVAVPRPEYPAAQDALALAAAVVPHLDQLTDAVIDGDPPSR